MRGGTDAAGFTLVEVLVGSAISLAVVAVACQLAIDAQAAWRSSAASADQQQRARVATDRVGRWLRDAGAGPLSGTARASLVRGVPAVVPRRTGRRGDAADVFRTDAFTTVRAVPDAEHGILRLPLAAGGTAIALAPGAGCTPPSCGFGEGDSVMLLDAAGNHDLFTVTGADGLDLTLRHHGAGAASRYDAGTPVVAIESTSLSFDPVARFLRVYDGDSSDLPLLDEVVEMTVRFWGSSAPPVWPKPPTGQANCLYAIDGSYDDGRMPDLGGDGLVELGGPALTDGPWCGAGGTRFDADLLRLRRVRVTLRLQAGDAAVRGADRLRFANPGHARREGLLVPDRMVMIDAALRDVR